MAPPISATELAVVGNAQLACASPAGASSGTSASSGTTAMSWNSRIAKARWP